MIRTDASTEHARHGHKNPGLENAGHENRRHETIIVDLLCINRGLARNAVIWCSILLVLYVFHFCLVRIGRVVMKITVIVNIHKRTESNMAMCIATILKYVANTCYSPVSSCF